MTDLTITVRGEHETEVPAELGVAFVTVRLDGTERGPILTQANELAAQLSDELRAAKEAGEVSFFANEQMSVWSDRPWNQDGKRLPLVHHASRTFRAEYVDFAALSAWVAAVSEREGVAVDRVEWDLTKDTERAREAEVAQGAVQVAVARATAYAAALNLHTVTAVEIADRGLMSAKQQIAPVAMMSRMASESMDSAGGAMIELEPRTITVSATVEARFIAS